MTLHCAADFVKLVELLLPIDAADVPKQGSSGSLVACCIMLMYTPAEPHAGAVSKHLAPSSGKLSEQSSPARKVF